MANEATIMVVCSARYLLADSSVERESMAEKIRLVIVRGVKGVSRRKTGVLEV